MSITALRTLEQRFLKNDGKIDATEAKKLLKGADDAGERQALRDMLARDTFEPKARKLFETKLSSEPKPVVLGAIRAHGVSLDATVKQTLSPPEGYANKLQATAAAQGYGGMAMVVEDAKGRWHALGTNMPKNVLREEGVRGFEAGDSRWNRMIGVNDGIQRGYYGDLRKEAFELKRKLGTGEATQQEVDAAFKKLVAHAAGVEESDVHIASHPKDYVAGKINFDYGHDKAGSVGRWDANGELVKLPSDKTTPLVAPKLVLSPSDLDPDDPMRFQRAVFHESTHLAHGEKANALVAEWRASGSKKGLVDWLGDQKKAGKIDGLDYETTIAGVQGARAATEFAAHAEAFMATFGRVDLSNRIAVKEAFGELREAGEFAPVGEATKQIVYERMERAYLGLDAAHRKAFDDAVKAGLEGTLSDFRK